VISSEDYSQELTDSALLEMLNSDGETYTQEDIDGLYAEIASDSDFTDLYDIEEEDAEDSDESWASDSDWGLSEVWTEECSQPVAELQEQTPVYTTGFYPEIEESVVIIEAEDSNDDDDGEVLYYT
jgi:hypothetical protein